MSRLERAKTKDEGLDICLPECIAEYLVLLFYEAGMYSVGMSGILPLSWNDLNSWIQVSGRELNWFEITAIRDMSVSYCNEYSKASDRGAIAPFVEQIEMTPEKRKELNDELKRTMEALMAKNNKE